MPGEPPKAIELENAIFRLKNEKSFEALALQVFYFQYQNNAVYRQYCEALRVVPASVNALHQIPFLPISFFKTHNVQSAPVGMPDVVFESSGTTGQVPSRHYVHKKVLYERSFLKTFEKFYGSPDAFCVIGLLPSYLERGHSSLVYMVDDLIKCSAHPASGFYLHDFEKLHHTLQQLEAQQQPTILFGVTYALLDFAESFPMQLQHTAIIETGGMKGRKKELLRTEVHGVLKKLLGVLQVHSEYGMTELLSQAYALQEGIFRPPMWMKVLVRDETDPLHILDAPASGGVNIIDLANIYSCAFIATEDAGRLYTDGSFEIMGRLDHAEVRGCSLLSI